MADGSSVCSVGLLENFLVQVKHMYFLVDFIVINVMHNSKILLGRPFLKTSKALIDVAHNCVTLESNGEKLNLNVFEQDGSDIESGATNYVAYCLAQLGPKNLKILLDEMVYDVGLEHMLMNALNEINL
ncbi:hypothetical protein BVRB_5g112040 [Beta vulgaris subsp. vulgaris]|nr:hypothetical protein BVRB_5g112040 [Beta vulgaris subsp. vulgaris]